MNADEVFAILLQRIKLGGGSTADIQDAVNNYLEANPVTPGASPEQVAQIEQNKKDIARLETEIGAGGTTNYEKLNNKPSINDVTLSGNKTLEQIGVTVAAVDIDFSKYFL